MKIIEFTDHIVATFTIKEREIGLVDLVEEKMPLFGINYSDDKLIWKVANNNKEKFLRVVKKFEADNSQTSLF